MFSQATRSISYIKEVRRTSVNALLILMRNEFQHLFRLHWSLGALAAARAGSAPQQRLFSLRKEHSAPFVPCGPVGGQRLFYPNGATFYKMIVSDRSIFQIQTKCGFHVTLPSTAHRKVRPEAQGGFFASSKAQLAFWMSNKVSQNWWTTTCIPFGWYPLVIIAMENHPSLGKSSTGRPFSKLSSLAKGYATKFPRSPIRLG